VDGLLTARVAVQSPKYVNDGPQRAAFYQKLEERLGALPGVERVALSASLPVWQFGSSSSRVVEELPEPPPDQVPLVYFEPVSPQYFETLGVRLLEGRAFTADDTVDRPRVVIVNETMARHFWPSESPIGKRIGGSDAEHREWEEVVGVVSDVGFPASLGQPDTPFQAFYPLAAHPPSVSVAVSLRTSMAPEALGNAVRQAVAEVDPGQAVFRIQTARSLVDQSLGSISLVGTLLGVFAALGLVLAVIGIYGVTSYSVAQRTGEIGIRMALGAQRRDVLWLVLGTGARLSLLGALLGGGGGLAVAVLLEAVIPALPTRDPWTFVSIALALIAVTLAACYLPARRATRVDPLVALRHE
jgi:predicted permease